MPLFVMYQSFGRVAFPPARMQQYEGGIAYAKPLYSTHKACITAPPYGHYRVTAVAAENAAWFPVKQRCLVLWLF